MLQFDLVEIVNDSPINFVRRLVLHIYILWLSLIGFKYQRCEDNAEVQEVLFCKDKQSDHDDCADVDIIM
jgi:hypothetical protein